MSTTMAITWTVVFLGALWTPICYWSSTIEYYDTEKYEDKNNGE